MGNTFKKAQLSEPERVQRVEYKQVEKLRVQHAKDDLKREKLEQ